MKGGEHVEILCVYWNQTITESEPRGPEASVGMNRAHLELVYLVTALVPSDTACLASSPGSSSRTAVCTSRLVMVERLLYWASRDASVAIRSNRSLTKEFMMLMARLEMPVSGWTLEDRTRSWLVYFGDKGSGGASFLHPPVSKLCRCTWRKSPVVWLSSWSFSRRRLCLSSWTNR